MYYQKEFFYYYTTVLFFLTLTIVTWFGEGLHKLIYKLKLQTLQNRYARMIINAEFLTPHNKQMLQTLHWQSVTQRIQYNTGLMMYKIMNDLAPAYLQSLVEKREVQIVTRYALACPLLIQKPRTDYYKKSFHYQGSLLGNNLPDCVRSSYSLVQYKMHIKSLSLIDRLWFHDTMLLLCSIYSKRILHIIFCFSSVSLHCHGLYNNCWRLCFRRMSSITFNVCIFLTIANLFSLNFMF